MKWSNIKSIMSKLNVIRRYVNYRDTLKILQSNNTIEIAEFLKMSNDDRDITLFCLTAAMKIKMEANTKLLWAILGILGLSTSGITYLGVT